MIRLQVKPFLVYKPGLNHNNVIPDADADFDLFDRVVIAKESHSVSLALILVHHGYSNLFDCRFHLDIKEQS